MFVPNDCQYSISASIMVLVTDFWSQLFAYEKL